MGESVSSLHEKSLFVSGEYKKREAELLSVLQEIDSRRAYLHFNTTSLYDYCVKVLKLSEGVSHSLISVARKSKEVPAMKEAIVRGELTLSKAHRIVSVINNENQVEWISAAATKTSREIEKAVATVNPLAAIKERVRYITGDRLEMNVGLSEEIFKKLERVMDLESQRNSKAATKEDSLDAALETYLQKYDPLRKAMRFEANKKAKINRVFEQAAITDCDEELCTGTVVRNKVKTSRADLAAYPY
jgi:plasmid maintenance system antidote protein VapI